MVKDKNKETEEVTKESKEEKIELLETVKEFGIGLRMPDGSILDLSNVDAGMSRWMAYVTETLDKLRKNLVG